jgi:ABC-type Fe3+ transport system substrate-binding protein
MIAPDAGDRKGYLQPRGALPRGHAVLLAMPRARQHASIKQRRVAKRPGRTPMSPCRTICFAIGLCLITAPVLAQSPTLAGLAAYSGPDRTQRLIAGAKKEGAVNIYSSMTVDDMKVISSGFEKKYGIKLQAWRASSEDILQRVLIEARGGRSEVDAIETSSLEMESLYREGMLQQVDSPLLAEIIPAAIRPHREWVGDRINVIAEGYNPDLVKKQDVPKSYADLLNPKWKGKLTIEADDSVWWGALVTAMGEANGLKFFRDLVRTNGLSLRKGHTLIANLIVSGEVPNSLTVYHYKVEQLKGAGAPIEWQVLPPGIARFLGTGVLKRAPHPNAAILFFDFMMRDGQALLVNHDFTPTNFKVKSVDLPFTLIDPARVLDENQKWQRLFDEIIVKQK